MEAERRELLRIVLVGVYILNSLPLIDFADIIFYN